MKMYKILAIAVLSTIVFSSCSNDIENVEQGSLQTEKSTEKKLSERKSVQTMNFGTLPGVQPANGRWIVSGITSFWFSGAYRSVNSSTLPNVFPLDYNSSVTLRSRYAVGGRVLNGNYYVLGNANYNPWNPLDPNVERGVLKISPKGNNLEEKKFLKTGTKNVRDQDDEVNFTFFNNTTAYLTDGESYSNGIIKKFNPNTMVITGEFDVAQGVQTAINSSLYNNASIKRIGGKLLIRRDNYLYADVTFGNSRNSLKQIVQSDNHIYIAVINVANGSVVKVLKSTASAQNIGLFNDHPLVNIDPVSGAIYFATVGNMVSNSEDGTNSKIFKIDINDNLADIVAYNTVSGGNDGEFNTMYAYNGKIYTTIASTSVSYLQSGHGVSYRENIWKYHMIDAQNPNSAAATINVPEDNFYRYQQPTLINGEIYFIVNNNNSIAGNYDCGIYKVTPGSTSATLVSKAESGAAFLGYPNIITSITKI